MDDGVMIQDINLGTAFFAYAGGELPNLNSCTGIAAFDVNSRALLRGVVLCPDGGIVTHVLRWGSNALAFIDLDGDVYLFAGTFVSGQ